MVFDGQKFTSFDTQLLSKLKESQAHGADLGVDPFGDDGASAGRGRSRPRSLDHGLGVAAMAAFVALILIAAGIAFVARQPGHGSNRVSEEVPRLDQAQAMALVASAVQQTVAANRFDFDYDMVETPGPTSSPPTSQCVTLGETFDPKTHKAVPAPPAGSGLAKGSKYCFPLGATHDATVKGSGTVNISPKAMSVTVNSNKTLSVVLTMLGDQVRYDNDSSNLHVAPVALSDFAETTEGTLGPREGALSQTQLASPNGYLALEAQAITGATAVGSATVDGRSVTNYDVDLDLTKLLTIPGLTPDEQTSIQAALGVLHKEGMTATTVRVSVDGSGFIRQIHSVTQFADGGKVTNDTTYRNFGCAPIVTGPGTSPTATSGPCDVPPPTTGPSPSTGATEPSAPASAPSDATAPTTSLDRPGTPTRSSTTVPPTSAPPTSAPPAKSTGSA
jgi:hypothetical protein